MNRKRSREEYLELCADILCREAYRMCKRCYVKAEGREKGDAKSLKEACSAVKEAANVVSGLEKKTTSDSITISFSDTLSYTD